MSILYYLAQSVHRYIDLCNLTEFLLIYHYFETTLNEILDLNFKNRLTIYGPAGASHATWILLFE